MIAIKELTEKLTERLEEMFGCDPMYYGTEAKWAVDKAIEIVNKTISEYEKQYVRRETLEQYKWERDVAISQPNELGLSLGQKVDHVKESEDKDDEEDMMIRASIKANLSRKKLIDTYKSSGLMGVYNLGLKNMLDYLGR